VPKLRWRASLAVLAVACLLAALETSGRVLYRSLDGRDNGWWAGAKNIFPVWITMALVVPFCAWMARRFPLDATNWPRRVPLHVLGGFVFCVVHLILDVIVQGWISGPSGQPLPRQVAWLFGYYVAVETFCYWGVTGTFMLVRREREMRERERVAAELERSLRQVRLEALRARLQPHFLFNTLNAITGLALRGEGERVAVAIGHLGELLRRTLDDDLPQTIPLERELELLDRYLEIQRLRFPDRLRIERRIAPDTLDALVPSFVLQPLVENAVQHGVSAVAGGRIVIAAARRDGLLELEVRDDGPGFGANGSTASGIGLANTRARLEQLYGSDQALECAVAAEGGACVRLRLPFHEAPGVTT
jgi:sensor histidine kinase YesM